MLTLKHLAGFLLTILYICAPAICFFLNIYIRRYVYFYTHPTNLLIIFIYSDH